MEIIITAWALDSYLEMKHDRVFSRKEYKEIIRPDALLLRDYPNNPKFQQSKFWSIATYSNNKIEDGYKMKWHQIGSGLVQLRLTVGMFSYAFLCEAYVKDNPKAEKRMLARFKVYLEKIRRNQYVENGRLT